MIRDFSIIDDDSLFLDQWLGVSATGLGGDLADGLHHALSISLLAGHRLGHLLHLLDPALHCGHDQLAEDVLLQECLITDCLQSTCTMQLVLAGQPGEPLNMERGSSHRHTSETRTF